MKINYAQQDFKKICDYLKKEERSVSVENIIKYSNAERLRIHTILFQMEQKGQITFEKRGLMGNPLYVRVVRMENKSLSNIRCYLNNLTLKIQRAWKLTITKVSL